MRKTVALFFTFAIAIFAWRGAAAAEPAKRIPRIGFLSAAPSIDPAFLEGLRALGYVDKKTIVIEHRSAQGNLDRLGALAAELVGLKVDLIVTQGTPASSH